jgi:hypothetical protein
MSEGEPRPRPEQLKPVTIELRTHAEQDAMLQALYGTLMTNTMAEIRGTSQKIIEQNQILRPIFRTLATNLGRELDANEWLMLGIVDNVPLPQIEQWAKPTDRPGMMYLFASHFLEQKRLQVEQEQTSPQTPTEPT